MKKEQAPNTESWVDFAGDFLKPDLVDDFPLELPVIDVTAEFIDEKPKLTLETEYKEKVWKININKTNQMFIRNNNIASPRELIGKKLTLDKIKVRNPQTNSLQDSFIITKIE